MPFIKLTTAESTIKLLNVDSIREAVFDEKQDTMMVFLALPNGGGVQYALHGAEAREAFAKLKNL